MPYNPEDHQVPPGYSLGQIMREAGHAWAVIRELRAMDTNENVIWSEIPPEDLAARIVRLAQKQGWDEDRNV